jgi:hypothetical protein
MDSTVSGNTAKGAGTNLMGNGGGVSIWGGTARLVNSTISGNSAAGSGTNSGLGGGIGILSYYLPTTVELVNTTVSSNTAVSYGGGVANWVLDFPPTTTFHNTIIANNSAPYYAGCYNNGGTLTSLGYNLEDGDTCNLDQPTDIVNTDPMLEPLADNGGPTETHALPDDSPAADQGSCPGYAADQRGMPRPVDLPGVPNADDGCDVGAFEVQEDTTLPRIAATSPVSGAVEVRPTAPVVIEFSEPMEMESLIYSVDPDPGSWVASWEMMGSQVTLDHAPFDAETVHTVTVEAAADLSGNPLAGAPVVWSFTTGLHQLYLPLVLRNVP